MNTSSNLLAHPFAMRRARAVTAGLQTRAVVYLFAVALAAGLFFFGTGT